MSQTTVDRIVVEFITADPMFVKGALAFDAAGNLAVEDVYLDDGGSVPSNLDGLSGKYYILTQAALPIGWDELRPEISIQYLKQWSVGIFDPKTGQLKLYTEQLRRHQGQHQEVQA